MPKNSGIGRPVKFVINYGCLDDLYHDGLQTIVVDSSQEVRRLATKFIEVIPDDPDQYLDHVKAWDPETTILVLTHQDDDTFYFSAVRVGLASDLSDFMKFCQDFKDG